MTTGGNTSVPDVKTGDGHISEVNLVQEFKNGLEQIIYEVVPEG
jgi:hypothetical protein